MLKHPEEIVWEFIVLLNELGIDISTDDINLRDDWLINLEESKYEIERNTRALLDAGLAIEVIEDMICQAPFLFTLSKLEVQERLHKGWGEDYINEMENMCSDDCDKFFKILEDIGW